LSKNWWEYNPGGSNFNSLHNLQTIYGGGKGNLLNVDTNNQGIIKLKKT